MELEWTRYPRIALNGTVLIPGQGKHYILELPRRGTPIFRELANLRTNQDVKDFVGKWGMLTHDAASSWCAPVLEEARRIQACVGIWEGSQRPVGLREWSRRAEGMKALRELALGIDGEWRQRWQAIKTKTPERATAIARSWLWLFLERGLAGMRWHVVADKTAGAPWLWPATGTFWAWQVEVPDLLTYCYLELAMAMVGRRLPGLCPYCGEVFLVKKVGRQITCGKARCRQVASRRHRRDRSDPKRA